MDNFIRLYTNKEGEIKRFLDNFIYGYNNDIKSVKTNALEYQINYNDPIQMSDMIGVFIDNKDSYNINMWICIDKGVLINITPYNADVIIRYLYERFPY